jgi:cell division protein FtsB
VNRLLFVAAGVVASLLVVATLAIRTYQASVERDHVQTLCLTISDIIHRSDQRLGQIAYYQEHPDELAAARAENAATIKRLDCGSL